MTNLTERKLKACQVKPIDAVPYSEELQALKEENARLKERDKIYSELAENLLCIEEEKWCDLVENGTKEQRIDFLLKTELEECFRYWGMDEYEYYGYEIVDEPSGVKQSFDHETLDEKEELIEMPEEFKYIDHEYCDQHCGICGDDYSGNLYFPLPSGKYLRCHYES